jgi:hypothetical protein
MPYYLHLKTDPLPTITFNILGSWYFHESRANVFEHMKASNLSPKDWAIDFLASSEEMDNWLARESARFLNGTYIHVPWIKYVSRNSAVQCHYCHLSLDKPGMVAFTLNPEHGITDRQTRMTPGRYLERFYPEFTSTQRAEFVAECVRYTDVKGLQLATSLQDILKIVNIEDASPSSCMVRLNGRGDYPWQPLLDQGKLPNHPYAVYADSDLAVAYFGPLGRVSQRVIVWPERKLYGKKNDGRTAIYGTGPLESILIANGYTIGSLLGARIRAIPVADGYLMPYIDGAEGVQIDGDWLVLSRTNKDTINCHVTDGFSGVSFRLRPHVDADNDDNNDGHCETERDCDHCGGTYDCGYNGNSYYCQDCLDNQWQCAQCGGNQWFSDRSFDVDGNSWCDYCYNSAQVECANEDCHNTFMVERFSSNDIYRRDFLGTSNLCLDCAEDYVYCDTCETSHNENVCPTCSRLPRCESTGNLFQIGDANVSPF